MSGYLLAKVLAVGKETIDKLGEIAPILIFVVIWVFSIIAKAASAAKKGGEGEQKDKGKAEKRQPDFNDIARVVRQRYLEAKEKAKKQANQLHEKLAPPAQTSRPMEPAAVYRSGTDVRRYSSEPQVPSQYEAVTPEMQPERQKLMVESSSQSTTQRQEKDIALPSHSYIAELTKQYSNVEGLRIALLHYEILGPPVGQRDI